MYVSARYNIGPNPIISNEKMLLVWVEFWRILQGRGLTFGEYYKAGELELCIDMNILLTIKKFNKNINILYEISLFNWVHFVWNENSLKGNQLIQEFKFLANVRINIMQKKCHVLKGLVLLLLYYHSIAAIFNSNLIFLFLELC